MTKNDTSCRDIGRTAMRRALGISVWLWLACILASAQITTPMDGYTPLSLTPGAPAGSYALSGFDNVNLFNGHLNFSLPFLQVGGRGSTQFAVRLNIENRWHIETVAPPPNCELTDTCTPVQFPMNRWWTSRSRWDGFTPGKLVGRQPGYRQCGPGLTVTRLTFSANDLTEFELRDLLYNGQPLQMYCNQQNGVPRGRVFITADGTSATFIPDTMIYDYTGTLPSFRITPSGYLMMRDGTRYHIDNQGRVTSIRDRNGNRVDFIYDQSSGLLSMIRDSLNRVVSFYYAQNEAPYGTHDKIVFNGFGGAERTIRISYGLMENALRSGSTLESTAQLFPEADFSDLHTGPTPYNPTVTTALWLPDGRRYQFLYDSYGNLARVVLPTGGALEYDYVFVLYGGLGKFVKERRVYSDANSSIADGSSVYTYDSINDPTNGPSTVTTVEEKNGALLLAKSKHYFFESAAAPSTVNPVDYPHWRQGREYKTEAYDTQGSTPLRDNSNNWQQRAPVNWWTGDVNQAPSNDPRVADTTSKLNDTNQVSKEQYSYDQYNNKTTVDEYDFGSGSPGTLRRRTVTTYVASNNGYSYDTVNPNTTNPDANTTIHLRSLPQDSFVYDGSDLNTAVSKTHYEYDVYDNTANHAPLVTRSNITGLDALGQPARGNVTKARRWLNTDDSWVETFQQYDVAGNVVRAIDAKNNPPTIFEFDDRYGTPNDEAQANDQNPTELSGGLMTYAFPTKVTNALGHVGYTQLDYYLGKPVNGEDANGLISSGRYAGFADGSYTDVLDRATELVVAENVAGLKRRTRFRYDDVSRLITTQSDQTTLYDGVLKTEALYDGLGRTTETRQYETSSAYITSKQQFDGLSRVTRSYNPYRTTSDETYGWTDTKYDGLGRVTRVETFDRFGASTGAVTTTFSGNATTVRDQANKQRRSITDALGRLKTVDEMLEYPSTSVYATTTYGYDVLDDLTSVTQAPQIPRTFVYDSLKRLTQASNPESGTINYTYDANSNLLTKQDSRSITTTYAYDVLNRVTSRTYSDTTPGVAYRYDGQSLPANYPPSFNRGYSTGRLVAVTYGGASAGNYTGYDQLGRVTSSYQQTDSQNYGFSYGYNLAGAMTSETYPSLRQITTTYDGAGRISTINGQKTGEPNKTYASQFSYAAHGAVKSLQLGNLKWEHANFNSRLQPLQIGLGTSAINSSILQLDYGYGTTNNNGNVLSQTITIGATVMTQSYGYDALNRLSSAGEGPAWSQTYDCDRYGNRAVRVGSYIPTPALTPQSINSTDFSAFNQSTNRLSNTIQAQSFITYDNAGNLTKDAANRSMTYDAENRQLNFSSGAGQYSYDGDGRRVKKIDGSGTTIFVYNVTGQLIAEYTSGTPTGSGTSYLTSDHLGSTRVVTKSDGTVKARYDYLPFGEELGAGVGQRTTGLGYSLADSTKQKFTQKERDSESGLDYFLARYYSSAQGRFTSPDPYNIILEKEKGRDQAERQEILIGYIHQPQIWNKYAYTINNPLKHTDPDGRRELTAEDEERLKILWTEHAKARASGDTALADSIVKGVGEILQAIKDVVEGDPDPENLRAVFFAIDKLAASNPENTAYAPSGTVSNGVTNTLGPGDNKCSLFCANAYAQGAGVGFGGKGVPTNTSFFGNKYPPTANDLGNPAKKIANLEVVNTPGLGDIAGFPAGPRSVQGHSGIYSGGGTVIYAGPKNVKIQTVSYVMTVDAHPSVTYRRYKP